MKISVTDAQARLPDLVRRAQAGDDVILTRHGQPAVRLVPLPAVVDPAARRAVIDSVRAEAGHANEGPDAARSQDFLYGDDGLPQ